MGALQQNLYGNYRNRTFNDIWPKVSDFVGEYTEFNTGLLDSSITTTGATTLYYLLTARYGNSTIASADEYQFKLKVFSNIFMYGPTWEKRLEIQEAVRNLSLEDIQLGGKAIYNTALNPSNQVAGSSDEGGTNTLYELRYINQQNTTNYQKSVPEAYSILLDLLETDVTKEFIDKFKKLFLTVVSPELPLWYVSDVEVNDESDDN